MSSKKDAAKMQTAAGFPLMADIDTKLSFSDDEVERLRFLARQVSAIVDTEENKKKADKWLKLNDLESLEPVVFADPENGWNEILTDEDLQCVDGLARVWEMYLLKQIYWFEEVKDDKVIERYLDVPYSYSDTGWGLELLVEGGDDNGAYHVIPCVNDYETDFPKLKFPDLIIDDVESQKLMELAKSVFDGILEVRRKTTWWWTLGMTWDFINLRGLDNLMLDLILNPDWVHKMMDFLSKGYIKRLDFLEENGYLNVNTEGSYVGSGGLGYTSELPLPSDITENVKLTDMWGFAESQETVGISPQMFNDFILPYQMKILEKFSLNCYGCCEPINQRWEFVKKIPNLRRVSASPWADKKVMAKELGRNYIISAKPSPTPLSRPHMDEDLVREELASIINDTKDCVVEIIMKDNHTLGNKPENLSRWVEIAREEIAKVYEPSKVGS